MQALSLFALATLAALAFFAGILLCALATLAYLLHRAATLALDHTTRAEKDLIAIISRNTLQQEKLESHVTAMLARVDASQMHEATLQIQRVQRQFARTVSMLYKLVLSQEGAAAIAAEEVSDSPDFEGINPQAYTDHLRQRAAEQKAEEVLASALHHPPPDPDEAWRLQEEEDIAGGPLA